MSPDTLSKITENATTAVARWANDMLAYGILLAAVGTIAMATLELLKALLRTRMFFHRFMMRQWLKGKTTKVNSALEDEVLQLAAGGRANESAWYAQPEEGMFQALRSAVNLAIQYPEIYRNFYTFLARGADKNDVEACLKMTSLPPDLDSDTRKKRFEIMTEINQARQRIENLVTQNISCLENRISYVWARVNQICSVILAVAFLMYFMSQDAEAPKDLFVRFFLAILGGLVAPFAKDIVSALSGLGTGSHTKSENPTIGGTL